MTQRPKVKPGEVMYRDLTVEGDQPGNRAGADDRIPVALSSEHPVDRWFGREILVHTPQAINFDHALDGLPFLDGHNTDRQIGLIENVQIRSDGKLTGMLKQGNHPDSGWIFRDIREGIRRKVSIGYRIDEWEIDEDQNTYWAVRWTPMEGSTVSVPADITVGVGRSAELSYYRGNMSDEPQHGRGVAPASLDDQRQEIANITRLAIEHGMQEHLAGWFERGLSRDQVKAEIVDRKPKPVPTSVPGYLDLSNRDSREYGVTFSRALVDAADRRHVGGIIGEASRAIAQRSNRQTPGLFVPLDLSISTRASVTGNIAATSSLGGAGVQTSVLTLIDLLRNKMLTKAAGATVLSGLTGNITFPRHIVPNTMAWEGENPSTGHAHSAATFDNVLLSPKTAMSSSAYSRQLLIQESFDVSSFIQNDIAAVLAVGLDLAVLDGTGSANQPTGIMRQTGVITITHTGTNGGVPTWADMVSYETQIATNNGDVGNMAFIMTPGLRGKLKNVLVATSAGSTMIWNSDNTINGYPAFATANMPSNFTAGTSTTIAHGIVFGVWSEVLIGEWGGILELIVDPFTSASQGMVNVTGLMLVDCGVRHPKAMAVSKTALAA